jgi:hypothetical protein
MQTLLAPKIRPSLGLVSVQFVPTIHSIVPPFAANSAQWDRFLFHWGAVARTLGTSKSAVCLSVFLRNRDASPMHAREKVLFIGNQFSNLYTAVKVTEPSPLQDSSHF